MKILENGVLRDATAEETSELEAFRAHHAYPASPRTIAGAYFRAALTDMGEIDRVRAALTDPIDRELFNTATEFSKDAADVNAVATALSIDLSAVFDRAEAIRNARA